MNSPDSNTRTAIGSNGITITVTPVEITVPGNLGNIVSLQITVQSPFNFTGISVAYTGGNFQKYLGNFTFSQRDFFNTYVSIQNPAKPVNGMLGIKVDNGSSTYIQITVHPSYKGLYAEVSLFTGIALIGAVLVLYEIESRRIWPLIPAYVFLSAVFGQRYDDFFLISSGLRVIFGVNPYITSASLLPGLQWAYPPGFIPWSYLVGQVYLHLPGISQVTNSMLNYAGTQYGDMYGTWRGLAGFQLLVLYPLIKLPMVVSFFWVYLQLKELTGKNQLKLWLLNPIAVVVGVLWGQLDVLAVAFMLQSLLSFRKGKTAMSVLFASAGAAIKVFPVLIIPYIIYRSQKRLLAACAMLPVFAAVFVIYQMTGGFLDSVLGLFYARSVPTFQGIFTSNGLTWQVVVTALGIRSFPSLFLYAFIPAYAILTFVSAWKHFSLEEYAIVTFLAFFVTYNFVNPQYMIWVIPLLIIAGRKSWAKLLTALASLYMLLTYSYTYFINPQLSWNYHSSLLGQMESLRLLVTGSPPVVVSIGILSTALFGAMLLKALRDWWRRDSNTILDIN